MHPPPPFPFFFFVAKAMELLTRVGCVLQWLLQESSAWLQQPLRDGKQRKVWYSADGTDGHCASPGALPGAPTGLLAAFVNELGGRDSFVLLSFLFLLHVILLLATRQQQCSSVECERFSNKRSPRKKKKGGICCFSVTTGQLEPPTSQPPMTANNSVYSELDHSGVFGPQTGLALCECAMKQHLSLSWFCCFAPRL